MRKIYLAVVLGAAVTLTFSTAAMAGKGKVNKGEDEGKVTPKAESVSTIQLATQLADYGTSAKNPAALLVAAQIMKNTPSSTANLPEKIEDGKDGSASKKSGAMQTPETLLASAKAMAAGQDMQLAALIDQEMSRKATRGDITGPNNHLDRVSKGRTDSYRITMQGRELARVAVIGDGDCDLDLYVYDEHGNSITHDSDGTDRCLVEWTPRYTGPFVIKVKNYSCKGNISYANYRILTN